MPDRQFVDLFAGCGGLSLGLTEARWRGLFAVERDAMAFETFATNFLSARSKVRFAWPGWLEQRPWLIDDLLAAHGGELRRLRGQVDLVAGGPPCQGFSFAGRRKKLDPRNMLFKKYVEVVDSVRPQVIMIENVLGMRTVHGIKARGAFPRRGRPPEAFSERLINALSEVEYEARSVHLDAADFGVPQRRPRLFILGVRRTADSAIAGGAEQVIRLVEANRLRQLKDLGLTTSVSSKDAIGDLETTRARLRPCNDPESKKGFQEPDYRGPVSHFQRLMRGSVALGIMDSSRLARHTDYVRERYQRILEECRQGVQLSDRERARLGFTKQRVHPMSAKKPAPTITTLPDDIVHYSEPRILSVRECARLQSFPDWFQFRGRYTTGGDRRTRECPRYTQVGNAVAPLLGRAVGLALAEYLDCLEAVSVARPRLAVG